MEEKKHREGKGGKYLEKDNVAFGGEEKRRKKKRKMFAEIAIAPPPPLDFQNTSFTVPLS